MKLTELMAVLTEVLAEKGDVEIMFEDRFEQMLPVGFAQGYTAEEGEFDEDWNMPAGFSFVLLME